MISISLVGEKEKRTKGRKFKKSVAVNVSMIHKHDKRSDSGFFSVSINWNCNTSFSMFQIMEIMHADLWAHMKFICKSF